jgi:hypothetical protein
MSEQTGLQNAMFGGSFARDTILPSDILPKLTRVSSSPLILAAVVPNRKIKEVEVCLVQHELFKDDILNTASNILSYSTGPLTALQIIACLSNTQDAFTALMTIPNNLPKLTSFSFCLSHGAITEVRIPLPSCVIAKIIYRSSSIHSLISSLVLVASER